MSLHMQPDPGPNDRLLNTYEFCEAIYLILSLKLAEPLTINGGRRKSSTGPTERTPKKPGYLISIAFYLGVRWSGPIQF